MPGGAGEAGSSNGSKCLCRPPTSLNKTVTWLLLPNWTGQHGGLVAEWVAGQAGQD